MCRTLCQVLGEGEERLPCSWVASPEVKVPLCGRDGGGCAGAGVSFSRATVPFWRAVEALAVAAHV